ncbi:hypothetical protein BLNAU_9825 [Blattamonas nauphoetae]|uniref:Uncharacterized protein n=1 Tax=Blattamonas nauphoetae TaxID=2049346 RepID=A0ABQ9XUW2_9EUKA|nr:hypothetical protein BLNAU_9825 [Blattamonas nauphoetae]
MIATHSPSPSPPLSHCSNCSEMEAVDADDWLRFDRLLLWTYLRCHFRMDPHRRSSSTLRKGDRIKMVVHAHHPNADLSPSRNEKQKEDLKRGKQCDGNDTGHASLRPPNDLCAHQLFRTLIEAALLPQLLSILFAWLLGIAC